MSKFWHKKMCTYFKRIDFDGDGKITRADFEGMAKRFAETGKLNEARSKDLFDTLTAVWDNYVSVIDAPEGLNQGKFIAAMKHLVKDDKKRASLEGPLPLFFHAVDSNDDGFIDVGEYEEFFKIFGLDPALAAASFRAIDANDDGLLSKEEFKDAGRDFFLKDDEKDDEKCPTSLFWGPLPSD